MNAVEKVAWTELAISLAALLVAIMLYPWLGQAALGGFCLLGLLGLTPIFLRRRGDQVVKDERDASIERTSSWFGFGIAWITMMLSLTVITMWHIYVGRDVPTGVLSVVLWAQFALCYVAKGATTLLQYRIAHRAA